MLCQFMSSIDATEWLHLEHQNINCAFKIDSKWIAGFA